MNTVVLKRPYLLSSPGLLLFIALLGTPLLMTLILSFYSFDYNSGGILPGFSWANYTEVLSDSYFHRIFGRTFAVALGVTFICVIIGVPEAYILSRMRNPWKSIFFSHCPRPATHFSDRSHLGLGTTAR